MDNIFSFATRIPTKSSSTIGWESRYDGVLSVAVVDSVPVAGISGPWPDGNYALTWWSTDEANAVPTLEFHGSMEIARQRVEDVTGHSRRAAA
ncbi:hypothetical protein [Dokdonella sp.]|uniref:hypothetical protein n=1 Tax=Dokdonella sp. TaxID=2291710 RepID=UPI003C319AA9